MEPQTAKGMANQKDLPLIRGEVVVVAGDEAGDADADRQEIRREKRQGMTNKVLSHHHQNEAEVVRGDEDVHEQSSPFKSRFRARQGGAHCLYTMESIYDVHYFRERTD